MVPNTDRTWNRTPTGSRPDAFVPLAEAAHRLGISYDAARRRIARGTLPAEKRGARWYVAAPPVETGPDHDPNARPDATGPGPDALIAQLRDENAFLRQQVAHQATTITMMAQRLAELPAGETVYDAPERYEKAPLRGDVAETAPEPLRPSGDRLALGWRRWWRRMTGG